MKSKANLMMLKVENQVESKFDWLKWTVAILLLVAGIIANHYYADLSIWFRLLGWVALAAVAGFIISKTQKGRWTLEFIRDSRMELRKVIWPTRQETMQTTLVVAAMVIVLAIILWGVDGVLVWLIGWLTGQHG